MMIWPVFVVSLSLCCVQHEQRRVRKTKRQEVSNGALYLHIFLAVCLASDSWRNEADVEKSQRD